MRCIIWVKFHPEDYTMPVFLAAADTAATGAASTWGTVVMIVLMLAVFYFFFIRPQRKQEKETNEMRNNLAVGDEIVTIGGIIGIIIAISSEDTVTIVTSRDRTRLHILKSAISRVTVPVNGTSDDKKEKTDAKPDKSDKKKDKNDKDNSADTSSDKENK